MGERRGPRTGRPRTSTAVAAWAAAALALAPAAEAPAADGPAGSTPGAASRDTTPADTVTADSVRADASAAGDRPAGDTSVVYRREVFDYPAGERRNPFKPLDTGESAGPRLEDLTLAGILYSPDAGSVAVLVDSGTGRRYRLRRGDRIGEARLVDLAADSAVFRVEAFGFDRRTVLRLQRDEERSP